MMTALDMGARFEQATAQHLDGELVAGYRVRPVARADWEAVFEPIAKAALPREFCVRFANALSDDERERMAALNQRVAGDPLTHYLVFERDGETVGHYYGLQESRGRYYMCFTAVAPAHQGKGLYGAFLPRLLACVEQAGFLEIFSRHHADNNAVLIPKLRHGFVIAGFELAPKYGVLIELRRYFNEGVRRLHAYRVDAAPHGASLRADGIVEEP